MRAQDRFLTELYRRTNGQSDYPVHSHLHVAKPLGLSRIETQSSIAALLKEGLIEADGMFDRLIWLTPAGVAACERPRTMDTPIYDSVTSEPYAPLVALRGAYADIAATATERELVTQ